MSKVKIISYSQTEDNKSLMDQVAYCARVSNPSNQMNTETNQRLIKYLIKNQHWSPFEMVSLCMEINTTRDIAKQILRHRSFSFQEFSQRYAQPDEMGDMFEFSEARLQDKSNRQNSIETDNQITQALWEEAQRHISYIAKKEYKRAIEMGIAKEVARKILPEGITKTKLYMNGTLRSWMHYILLRRDNGTQKEHADIAKTCEAVIGQELGNINWLEFNYD